MLSKKRENFTAAGSGLSHNTHLRIARHGDGGGGRCFQITINLGSDVLHFDKSIAIDANDVDPFNDTDTTPKGLLPVIAANKRKDDGGGEPL